MNIKSVTSILKKTAEELINETSIDPNIRKLIKKHGYITGGAIPSLISDQYVNDFDIYLDSKEIATMVSKHFENHIKNVKKEDLGLGFYKILPSDPGSYQDMDIRFVSLNAVTFYREKKPDIQIMTGFSGTPKEVTESFDWEHIKSYFTFHDMKLYLVSKTYELLANRTLKYSGSKYPLSSLLRTRKYLKKGWNISAHDMTLMALDLQRHDLTNRKTLIEQMSGIDPLYIAEELERLSDKEVSIDERIDELNRLISDESGWDYIDK